MLAISRSQMIYGLCLPLAVVVGYFLAEPLAPGSLGILVLVLTVLGTPLFVRWYHPLLVFSLNAVINPFFLPGRPYLWIVLAFLGILVAVLNRAIEPTKRFLWVNSVSWSLLFLAVVVALTAATTGGIGVRALGSESYGGRGYFFIWAAIAAYFVLTSQAIPPNRAKLYVALFFLSGLTAFLSDLAYMGWPRFSFLYHLIALVIGVGPVTGMEAVTKSIVRLPGTPLGAMALFCFLLARFGIKGILDVTRPWRLALLVAAFVIGLFGGYRSFAVNFLLIFGIAFYLEGLHRTRLLPILLVVGLMGGLVLMSQFSKLPPPVQRTLSFLPADADPFVRQDAASSLEWRLDLWRQLLPDLPKYFWKGKGYAIKPDDLFLSWESVARGLDRSSEGTILVGNFHNGPLSIFVPFGIWGALAFGWFIIASLRVLFRNYLFSEPELKAINTFLLAYFVGRLLFFLLFFGALFLDLVIFVGIVGLSVSLNRGVRTEPQREETTQVVLAEAC